MSTSKGLARSPYAALFLFIFAAILATAQPASAAPPPPVPAVLDLSTYPHLRLDGTVNHVELTGWSVSDAGDVNGDGRPDVVVGAFVANFNGRADSGAAFVVFGGLGPGTIGLDSLGPQGFRIEGAAAGDGAGWDVSGAGDVNGDGLDDVVIGADGADNNNRAGSSSAYVVFGKATTGTIDLAALGAQGFRIDGASAGDGLTNFSPRYAVSGAGDMNADGLDDVVVGAGWADNNGRTSSGSAWVVYGRASTANVDLASLGAGGFRIDGAAQDDALHPSAGAGDFNGDGFGDLVLGTPFALNDVGVLTGAAWVVFGRSSGSGVDLASLGSGGLRMEGAVMGDATGNSVDGAGDVDRDGLSDVIVGAAGADGSGRNGSGVGYVIFGRDSTRRIDLAALNRDGFRIDGAASFESMGHSVAGAGDVNADGFADVVLGAPGAEYSGSTPQARSGSAYVVLGRRSYRTVDLASGSEGFRIDAAGSGDGAGWDVSGAGDVNADGRPDVIVGAPRPNTEPGSAHVVFSPPCQKIGPGRGNGTANRGFCAP